MKPASLVRVVGMLVLTLLAVVLIPPPRTVLAQLNRVAPRQIICAVGSVLNGSTAGMTCAPTLALGTGTTDANHQVSFITSVNGQDNLTFQNTSTGTSAFAELTVKADTTSLRLSLEGIQSSDSFGAQRAQLYSATGGGGAQSGKSGIDIVSCEAATPAACFTRFGTNGLSTGTVRGTIDATGLTINNALSLGYAAGTGASDANVSRLGAASLALGNGTAADFTGALKLTTLNLAGTASLTSPAAGQMSMTTLAFAALGTPANGTMAFCTDCAPTTAATCPGTKASCVCNSGGVGSFAVRVNNLWYCPF